MDEAQAKRILEALLLVFNEPVSPKRLAEILQVVSPEEVRAFLAALHEEYGQTGRAFRIQEVAGGFQLVTDPALAPWMRRALQRPKGETVSKGALETLAIIAYRQPVTKADIDTIRGVDVGAALDTLLERNLVKVTGRKETPGRPFLYGTTAEFLRLFGLKSLEALPPMGLPTILEQESAAAPAGEPAVAPADGQSA